MEDINAFDLVNLNIEKFLLFDKNNYRKDVNVNYNDRNVFCACEKCKALKARIFKNYENFGDYEDIFKNNLAKASYDALSIVVEKPGFFKHPKLLEKTDYNLKRIFFAEPGRYSLVSIYKQGREYNFSKSIFSEDFKGEINRNSFSALVDAFSGTLPIGDLTSSKAWRKFEKQIIEFSNSRCDNFDNVFKLLDRYIPLIFIRNEELVTVNKDGSPENTGNLIPGMHYNNEHHAREMVIRKVADFKYRTSSSGNNVFIFAYDIIDERLVYSSDLASIIYDVIKDNVDKYIEFDSLYKIVSTLPSPASFIKELNLNFIKMGAFGFTATAAFPGECTMSYVSHNYETEEGVSVQEDIAGYKVDISYNGNPQVGSGGGGWVWVRVNEDFSKFTLIQSSWCQRVSSWSKNKDEVVDQHYNIWDIADWLSGPYAEMMKLNVEALVFKGNRVSTRKSDVLDNLRAKLAAKF